MAYQREAERALARLVKSLATTIAEASSVVEQSNSVAHTSSVDSIAHTSSPTVISEHFDHFDLTIRRHISQTSAMFPQCNVLEHTSSIIQDDQARFMWEANFGTRRYCVPFEEFFERVLVGSGLIPQNSFSSGRFKATLSYYINFPADDMITPYKWHLLVRLFGPTHQLVQNFTETVLGRGFLGVINRIRAEELLKEYQAADQRGNRTQAYFLLRFSRTATKFLVTSFIRSSSRTSSAQRVVHHSLITPNDLVDNNKRITLSQFIKKRFTQNGYIPVPMQVDAGQMVAVESVKDLSQRAS
eukprot:CAMPEP_0201548684 /NCGR_PEP_ID=MMETSP0173_2-20130828/5214_1 /ASSEMBLY_ACC=CAM_ASM_000268 /TAXON_ID=218659 /ORGANISM="Vexillifera sp., Strain DIVA3 564/2" /LENGTH=299 /DNA_ID=CAMNT_0047958135 /DNA_START=883 /DNA_END=1779 /DNA_ORIENTATION=+